MLPPKIEPWSAACLNKVVTITPLLPLRLLKKKKKKEEEKEKKKEYKRKNPVLTAGAGLFRSNASRKKCKFRTRQSHLIQTQKRVTTLHTKSMRQGA